jgi:hypothetical protein
MPAAFDFGCSSHERRGRFADERSEIGRMVDAMIAKASQFCGPSDDRRL